MQTRLIAYTQAIDEKRPEDLIVYCARVSSPQNQNDIQTGPRLLKYCAEKGHWSVFETVSATLQIRTSRAIAAQILRHRSFTFQEFSQRYSTVCETAITHKNPARTQAANNRQASADNSDPTLQALWKNTIDRVNEVCGKAYENALTAGVSREQARFLLPLGTPTILYMTGSLRSWIHYLQTRLKSDAQPEHREIAFSCLESLRPIFPVTLGIFFPEAEKTQ
jgi:thymidylate synthase (FAD)